MPRGKRSGDRWRCALSFAALTTSIGVDSAISQSSTWTYNGPDVWSSTGAWFAGAVANGAGNLAGFGTGVNIIDTLTVNLDSSRTIGNLSFADTDGAFTPAGWLIRSTGGHTLTLEDVGEDALPTLNVANLGGGNSTTFGTLFQKIAQINANLAGSQGFEKTNGGTLLLSGNNAGLSGPVSITGGVLVLGHANALGSATLLTQRVGQLAFRNDTATTFTGTNIILTNDSTFGTGNSIGTQGLYGVGSNQSHTIGNVTIDQYGVRNLGISGSNGYGLNLGRLTLRDGVNLINQGNSGSINGAGSNNNVNGLGSGNVTIGTITYGGGGAGTIHLGGVGAFGGNFTVANGIEATGGGSATLVYSGDKTLTLNGPIGTAGDTYLTGSTTGTVAALTYQAGVGTMILNSGALPSNRAVTINGGTMILNGGALTHNVSNLVMGGATLTGGAVPALMNLGSGTLAVGSQGVTVNDSIAFDTGTTIASAIATAAGITGTVDLGGSNRSVAVAGTSTLTVNGPVVGSGGVNKSGTGALLLNGSGSNTFTGNIDIQDGMVSGNVRTSGNAFGAGSAVSLGGSLRLVGSNVAGTGTVSTLSSKDTGGHEGLIVDASLGGVTTLNINTYTGREAGTRGTIKVVPVTGSMNTNEIVRIATGAPLPTNGILPAYFAVQNSGTNTQLGFAGIASNRITSFGGYAVGGINAAAINAVYDQTATETLSGGKQLYALRIGAGASLNGAQILTLGDGASGFGGLIMNGGAMLNASTLTTQAGQELVVWSGGSAVNTISSNINLLGDLTTGGAQALEIGGTLNLNGNPRAISVTGGTTTLSNNLALSGGNALIKRGGGVLAITGNNVTNNGTVGIFGGTLQIGASGATGGIGNGAVTNNANLVFARSDTATFSNAIGGSGDLWVNGTSLGNVILTGPLTYTGKTTVQTGTLRGFGASNRLPTGTALRVESGATFNMNGFAQSLANLSGGGTVTNSVVGVSTLTISDGGTFTGSIINSGAGSVALTKSGSGTLILGGPGNFNGTISLLGGTLQVNTNTAIQSVGADAPIVLNGGALALNIPNNQNITPSTIFFLGNSTISVLTNPPVNLGQNQDGAGPGIQSGANSWLGNGTVNLVLNGRMLNIGDQAFTGNVNQLTAFTGTLKFDDNNPVGSRVRFTFGGGGAAFTAGSPGATFAFGNGHNLIQHRFGTALFNMGFVSGGTNTILEGHTNDAGRRVVYNFGLLNGDQTFHGQIRDNTTQGAIGFVDIAKVNASSSLTLKNTLSFTGGITVNAGTLFLASGVNITNSASLTLNGGTLSILPGATFTTPRIIASVNGGAFDVTSFGTAGFNTPGRMTFTGGGTVYGNVNHNAGSINPGAIGGPGTLTFSNTLNLNNGSVDFDLNPGSVNLLGGTNDVLKVNASNGLTISSGIIRLNFLGASTTPPPTVAPNQFYPIIAYNGTFNGALSSIFTTAKFRGSFALEQGTGSLSNTIGAKVIALGGATNNLVWNPVSSEFNAWDAAVGFTNFKPLVGAGSLFFFSGDSVTFDDTTTIRTVQLTPGLAPTSITVNTAGTYIFTGQGIGSITGSTGLVKNGTGTLWLSGDNDYTGGTTINGGTLVVGDPFSPQLTPRALGGGAATTTFNGNSNFQIFSPTSNTFAGPGGAPGVGAVGLTGDISGGTFVFNGNHRIILNSSNIMHPFNINMFGSGTLTVQRPSLDGNNTHLWFNQGTFPIAPGSATTAVVNPFANFTGTIKLDDATNVAPGGGGQGWTQFRDGTILRLATTYTNAGNPSMIIDLGQGTAGFSLGGAGHTMTIGAIRGGPNTFFKQDNLGGAVAAGTFIIAGVGPQYDSTFHGLFRANGNNTVNAASIQLVNVVKAGSLSTLTLTNQQPYVGNTIVNGGTLALANASSNPLASPTILIGTDGVLDVSGLAGSSLVLNTDQRLISNGNVVGGSVQVVAGSTIGGTKFGNPIIVDNNATISPGNNNVASLTVSNLQLGSAFFTVEVDQTGIDSLVLSGTQLNPIVSAQSTLNLVNLGGFSPGTYTFLDYTGNHVIQTGIEFGFLPTEFPYQVQVIHDTADTSVKLTFTNNTAQWFVNSNGTWSTANNWTLDGTNPSLIVPNAVTFGTFIQAPRTVNVNGTTGNIANSIVFDSPHAYTIAGPGTLTLDSGVVAPITVVQGNHAINAPVRALRTLGVSVPSSNTLSFGGTITNANNAGINKLGSGTASFTRLNMPGGTLNVNAGTVVMSAKVSANNVSGTSVLARLSIAAGARMDLTNNAMILDSVSAATVSSQLLELRAELADGRLFSSTTTSTTSLGYRSNNTGTAAAAGTTTPGVGLNAAATFAGMATDNTSVLVRVTYKGDTNLDGIVSVLDLVNLALNWGSTNGVWAGGDFNYDGLVNNVDLGLLAQNWQSGSGNPLPAGDLESALTSAGIPLSAIPEPGTLSLAGLGVIALLSRRRRR